MPMMSGGIDNLVNQRADMNRGDPQKLAASYAQNQELLDLLALQKIKSEKEAAKRDMMLKAAQQSGEPTTVAQQMEQQMLDDTKQRMTKNVGGAMRQQHAQQQQRLQQLLSAGIPRSGRPVPAQRMASGGIVALADGGRPEDEETPRVDPRLIEAVIEAESGGDPRAVSSAGAQGLMQVMPDTAANPGYGVAPLRNAFDPEENRRFGSEYLDQMLRRYGGDVEAALVAYNAGPANADRFVEAGKDYSVLPQPEETQPYVQRIMGQYGSSSRTGNDDVPTELPGDPIPGSREGGPRGSATQGSLERMLGADIPLSAVGAASSVPYSILRDLGAGIGGLWRKAGEYGPNLGEAAEAVSYGFTGAGDPPTMPGLFERRAPAEQERPEESTPQLPPQAPPSRNTAPERRPPGYPANMGPRRPEMPERTGIASLPTLPVPEGEQDVASLLREQTQGGDSFQDVLGGAEEYIGIPEGDQARQREMVEQRRSLYDQHTDPKQQRMDRIVSALLSGAGGTSIASSLAGAGRGSMAERRAQQARERELMGDLQDTEMGIMELQRGARGDVYDAASDVHGVNQRGQSAALQSYAQFMGQERATQVREELGRLEAAMQQARNATERQHIAQRYQGLVQDMYSTMLEQIDQQMLLADDDEKEDLRQQKADIQKAMRTDLTEARTGFELSNARITRED